MDYIELLGGFAGRERILLIAFFSRDSWRKWGRVRTEKKVLK